MGIKIKNLQTGEFEKFNIPALKGEKGEPGEIEPSEKVDYIGKQHSKLRDTMNANVDYIIKTATGEFNYLDYEGQHITATNTIEGHAKSAILSGSTKHQIGEFIQDVYVPVQKFKTGYYLNWETGVLTSGQNNHKYCEDYIPLPTGVTSITSKGSSNWKKLCCYDSNKNFISGANGNDGLDDLTLNIPSNAKYFRYSTNIMKGKNEYINVVSNTGLLLASSNYNIPCELISCKMPVLTTSNQDNILGKCSVGVRSAYGGYIKKLTDTTGEFKVTNSSQDVGINFGGVNTIIGGDKWCYVTVRFGEDMSNVNFNKTRGWTLLKDNRTLVFKELTYGGNGIGGLNMSNGSGLVLNQLYTFEVIAIIPISSAWTFDDYEPYKTNILTVNEPIELRGIGEVQDTLDLLTGEVIERIGEAVLDGSSNEEYVQSTLSLNNTIAFGIVLYDMKPKGASINNKFITSAADDNSDYEHSYSSRYQNKNLVWFFINKGKLSSLDVSGFRQWLSQNPITVQYQLATESVKTVDLSDNHVYSYKGTTHYSCSSEEGSLVPTLSVKVPTDTQLTIQEQKATTQTLLIKNMDLQQSIKEVQAMNLAFNTALYNSFNSIREEVEDIKKHISTNENLEGSF